MRGGPPQSSLGPRSHTPLLWGYHLNPSVYFWAHCRAKAPNPFPGRASHPHHHQGRRLSRQTCRQGGTAEPPSPRLGADGTFSSDLEFLLLALKSRKEAARRYFHLLAVLNREEKPTGARRFVLLIANPPRSGTPRSALHPAGLGAIYLYVWGSGRETQSKPARVTESRERGFAQHSGDEEQSQAAARSPHIAGGRSPSSPGQG